MKDKILKMSENIITDEKINISVFPDNLEIEGYYNSEIEGSFIVKDTFNNEVSGFIYSSNPYVVVDNPTFKGKNNTINFHIRTYLSEGDILKGFFDIIYPDGNLKLPFEIKGKEKPINSSIGEIKTLDDFVKLCEINFNEALYIFHNDSFKKLLNNSPFNIKLLYKGYRKAVPSSKNLENFLEDALLKEELTFKVSTDIIKIKDIKSDQNAEFIIKRSTWGKLIIKVNTISSFIELSTDKVEDSDFLGREYTYHFTIKKDRLHDGKNYDEITLFDGSFKEKIKIEVSLYNENLLKEKSKIKKAKYFSNILNNLILFKEKKDNIIVTERKVFNDLINIYRLDNNDEDGILSSIEKEKSYQNLSELEEYLLYKMIPLHRLFITHTKILSNNKEKALKLISSLKDEIKDYLSFEWAYLLYLCILIEDDKDYKINLTKEIEKIFSFNPENQYIFMILLDLRKEYVYDTGRKLKDISNWVLSGYNSPFLLSEALFILNKEPYLLREFNKFIISTFNYAKRHSIIEKDLANKISDIVLSLNYFDKNIFRILTYTYNLYNSYKILNTIVLYLVKNKIHTNDASKWYRKGIDEGLNIVGLYESYINSLPLDTMEIIPESVFLYFRYPNNLSWERKALLYASIVAEQDIYQRTYENYIFDIYDFALTFIKKGIITDNLSVLYQDMVANNKNIVSFSECILPFANMRRIVVLRDNVSQVLLYESCYRKPKIISITNNCAYIPIVDSNYEIFLVDNDGTTYTSTNYYILEPPLFSDIKRQIYSPDIYSEENLISKITDKNKSYKLKNSDIKIVENIFKNLSISSDFIIEIYDKFYELLIKNGREDVILSYIWGRRNHLTLSKKLKNHIIEYAIKNKKFEEVYYYIQDEVIYLYNTDLILELLNYMIVYFEFKPIDYIIIYLINLLKNNKYSQQSISYLEKYFTGDAKWMEELFNKGIETSVINDSYYDRTIYQMLYTSYDNDFNKELFINFVKHNKEHTIYYAFLNFYSNKYILEDKKLPDEFFLECYRALSLNKINKDSVKIALLKYLSIKKDILNDEKNMLDKLLKYYISRNLKFDFFIHLPNDLKIKYHIYDKTYISYKGRRNQKLYLRIENDKKEPKIFPLIEMYNGIYTREIIIFNDDLIMYCIIKDKKDGDIIFSGKINPCINNLGKTLKNEGRFNKINSITSSLSNDDIGLKDKIKEYGMLDIMTRNLFKKL